MAIANVTSGNPLASLTTTLALIAPTVVTDDIMLAIIYTNDNVATTSTADWALIRGDNNTTTMRGNLFWKRASGGDSGSTNNFTIAGTTVGYGVITAWRGAVKGGSPWGNNTVSANASADAITYTTLTPQRANGAIIAVGLYADDLTTAGGIAGTVPTFANIIDAETATGNDASIIVDWGVTSGIATGARSQTTTSTADGVNIGYLLEIFADFGQGSGSSGADGAPTYPRLNRSQL